MRDDEGPTIVIERERGGSVGSFLLGALMGAGLALLFAPQSGAETQEEIRTQARKLKAQAETRVRAVQEEMESRLEEARAGVQNRIDGVRSAVDSGRQAAREARADLEHRLDQSKATRRSGPPSPEPGPASSSRPGSTRGSSPPSVG